MPFLDPTSDLLKQNSGKSPLTPSVISQALQVILMPVKEEHAGIPQPTLSPSLNLQASLVVFWNWTLHHHRKCFELWLWSDH